MPLQELPPPGVYPVRSPYDSFEAADALRKALVEEEAGQMPGIEIPVWKASPTVQGTKEQIRNSSHLLPRPLDDQPEAS